MKTNKQIKMELSKKLSPKIEELVNQRVEDNKKNGVSCSRSYIADQLGIDRNTLNFYINGDNGTGVDAEPRIPDIIGLYKIKNFFDVPYSYLLLSSMINCLINACILPPYLMAYSSASFFVESGTLSPVVNVFIYCKKFSINEYFVNE